MGCGCQHPFISKRSLRGFGDDSIDNLECPPGYTLKAERVDGVDKFWCENAAGERLGATATPVVPAGQQASMTSNGGGLGVIGWSLIASAVVVGGALVYSASRR